jgi:hypothetical protein
MFHLFSPILHCHLQSILQINFYDSFQIANDAMQACITSAAINTVYTSITATEVIHLLNINLLTSLPHRLITAQE